MNIVLEEKDDEPFIARRRKLCSTKSTLNDTTLQLARTNLKKDMPRLAGVIYPAIEEGNGQLKLLTHLKTKDIENLQELLSSDEARLLPSNRNLTPKDEQKIMLYKETRLSIRQILRLTELENNVEPGGLSFMEKDFRNFFTNIKKMIRIADYTYTIDEESRFEQLSKCPPQCFDWYDNYSDVVAFEVTYKVNTYDMPTQYLLVLTIMGIQFCSIVHFYTMRRHLLLSGS
ncbi:hypothetical protein Cgig2_019389 [Carnegiea gigantea]|uniref:FAR1-related sequence 11-like HTH-like domain-containing protein n=1 Tax=Carnegiea gigantea TaxID=171969 RepID=A0A9Q1QHB3_9CARY|nr:hypothetical protein Cgig2_019389 [Carnegiea gigantea]